LARGGIIELAKRNFNVVGIDASETFINDARSQAKLARLQNVKFLHEDGVSWRHQAEFDLGLCLYDVIGSFPVDTINEALFANLVQSVRPGGWIAVSVMSYEYLLAQNPKLTTSSEVHNHLVDLEPSKVMEQSGEIFDGRFVLLDTERRIAYRKEQFAAGTHPPIELVIADRRYDKAELRDLCERRGVDVYHLGYVRAGIFAPQTTTVTKELLVVGRRRAS
jgi:SAM-dependent methyltransferase